MKKLLILGIGAQGSTVARCMDKEPGVSEIICADIDHKAVDEFVKNLSKGKGVYVDAEDLDSIIEAADGVDLIVNALPMDYGKNVLEAALAVQCDYQDFTAPTGIHDQWMEGIKILYSEYSDRFDAIGKTAVIAAGSAPGLSLVAARHTMRYLDTCETIYNIIYEGVVAKRFLPFWWSPETALADMLRSPTVFENGRFVTMDPFSRPIYRTYYYLGKEHRFVEHDHDEPVHMGLNAEEYFKGVKNVYFKYGGPAIDLADTLYHAGLLSNKPQMFEGHSINTFNFVLSHIPPAPKYRDEIQDILDEGIVSDQEAMVIEAHGMKNGNPVRVETHVFAPGLRESFRRSGVTAEQYLTGHCAALFTKMFIEDKYTQTGLISPDMLEYEQVDYYRELADELDITMTTEVFDVYSQE